MKIGPTEQIIADRSKPEIVPDSELPSETDVIIVGGGIMGTSTAYHLATRSDQAVLLLEKDAIASGSTGDSSAILRHHYGEQAIYSTLAWWSLMRTTVPRGSLSVIERRPCERLTIHSVSHSPSPLP